MKKKQIKEFLNSIIKGVCFNFKIGNNYQCEGYPAAVDNKNSIWINNKQFNNFSIIEQKAMLLHEVGHILAGSRWKRLGMDEYKAQAIAIEIARKNKWIRIKNQLIKDITEWGEWSWNKDKEHRRYIIANKFFKEKGAKR